MIYDPSTNVYTGFNKIHDHQDICQLMSQPKQDYQLINHAYIVFQKEPAFRDSLIQWNRRQNDRTYNGFKQYMRNECNELAKVGGITVEISNFGSANLVRDLRDMILYTEEVTNNMKNEIKESF